MTATVARAPRSRRHRTGRLALPVVVLLAASLSLASAANLSVAVDPFGTSDADGYEITNPTPSTCTLKNVTDDSYVRQDSGNSNYGSDREILVKSYSGSRNHRSFIRVDVAGNCEESGQPIPANAGTISATLYLYISSAPGATRTYNIHRVTASWAEGSITWNNQPAVAGSATSSTATGTSSGTWKTFTVSEDVQAFLAGTSNYGWRISDSAEDNGTSRETQFCSSEPQTGFLVICDQTAYVPYLVITYQPETDVCTLRATQDSYVASAFTTSNYNGSYVEVSSGPGGAANDNNRAFFKFDLTGNCQETGVPMSSSARAVSASLDLYLKTAPGSSRTYNSYRVTTTWTETTPTWNWSNGGNVSGTLTSSAATGTSASTWKSWDVTDDVNGFLDGSYSNYGWMLRDNAESNGSLVQTQFCPREGETSCSTSGSTDTRPRLVVAYDRLTSTTCTLVVAEDSFVDDWSANTNFDGSGYLAVYGEEWFLLVPVHGPHRSYVKFTLGAGTSGNCVETGAAIPAGSSILSARLLLHKFDPPSSSRAQQVWRATGAWAEGTITWNNQPAVAAAMTDSATVTTADNAWVDWDVTGDVQAFWAGTSTNHGWRIRWDSESTDYDMKYCGKTGGDATCDTSGGAGDERPKLVITYQQ